MGGFWGAWVGWWQGKKTILGGCLVIAAGVTGVWYGKLDAVGGLTLVGMGLSIAGLSAKANRHQAELLTVLEGVAQAGADMRAGNRDAAIKDAEAAAVKLGPTLVTDVTGEVAGK